MNGVPKTAREELVSELEGLGFDTHAARAGYFDRKWRSAMTEVEMTAAIGLMSEDAPDWPDITDMVDAIAGATVALTLIEHPGASDLEALAACRAILLHVELATAANA